MPFPQHHTVPPARTAHAVSQPAASAVASAITALVESRACVHRGIGSPTNPFPIWPYLFSPAHHTVPSYRSTQAAWRPSAMSVTHRVHVVPLQCPFAMHAGPLEQHRCVTAPQASTGGTAASGWTHAPP